MNPDQIDLARSSERNDSLQVLRGLAALIVLVSHQSLTFEISKKFRIAIDTCFNSHAAVMIFFVLSGYVLSVALSKGALTTRTVFSFYVRRIFRIYPTILLSLFVAYIVAILLVSAAEPFGLTNWAKNYIQGMIAFNPFNMGQLLSAIIPINFRLLPQSWSLFVEVAASALMPLLFFAINLPRKTWLSLATLVTLLVFTMATAGKGMGLNYIQYIWHFGMGVFVFRLSRQYGIPSRSIDIIGVLSLVILIFGRAVLHGIENGGPANILFDYNDWRLTVLEGFAASIVVYCLATRGILSDFLSSKYLTQLGDYSFGIYLFHLPLAFAFSYYISIRSIWQPDTQFLVALLLTLATSFLLSKLTFILVEQPFIKLGKWTSAKIGGM
jgi:peptidoglycan/LPS O-acetylase OafA/YrhL